MITVLSAGGGGARLCAGLAGVMDPGDLTVVVNTADDQRMRGLHVSPDIDSVLYHLAGQTDWDRGWGMADETTVVDQRFGRLVAAAGVEVDAHEWFTLGDNDLATNLFRTRLLDAGLTLTEVTAALARAMGVGARVLPVTDDRVSTMITTTDGRHLAFQEYFVRERHAVDVETVRFDGADDAVPAPGVLDAITDADRVIIGPSNPVLSIDPILAVPGVRDALASRSGRIAISPIVGGRALKGPADRLLAPGRQVTQRDVLDRYRGLIDTFVIDPADNGDELAGDDVDVLVTPTVMSSPRAASTVAEAILHG